MNQAGFWFAGGLFHNLMLVQGGRVFSAGRGTEGQLGTVTQDDQNTPVRVAGLEATKESIVALAGGYFHSAAVTSAGGVFIWGQNYSGQLGLGDMVKRCLPVKLESSRFAGEPVKMVSCGGYHTLVLTEPGKLFAFGSGAHGQLGLGNKDASNVPVLVDPEHFGRSVITHVTTSTDHSGAVTGTGLVYTWGFGRRGRLGHNSAEEELVPRLVECQFGGASAESIGAGLHHTMVRTRLGEVWGFGVGEDGQLGVGDTADRYAPVRVGGEETFGQSKVETITCGYFHTVARTKDGAVWTWGCGEQGALGLGNQSDITVPTQIRQEHFGGAKIVAAVAGYTNSAAVSEDGSLFTWGTALNFWSPNLKDKSVPTKVARDLLQGFRVGRGLPLEPLLALAFAMGTHRRLGAQSDVKALGVTEVLRMVIDFAGDHVEHSRP